MNTADTKKYDFLILGSGIAGCTLALKLASLGQVALVCKETLLDSNTYWAQGGIASVLSDHDNYEHHVQDTLAAGAGLCHEKIVRKVVEAGPKCIQELIDIGVPFTKQFEKNGTEDKCPYHLTKEGGHSARRIIHADDFTGKAVQETLANKVTSNKNITIFEYHMGIDLIVNSKSELVFSSTQVHGAYLLSETDNKIFALLAKCTILATGGQGKLYLYTSNPDIATGDGLAMAWRAGARVANLEFMQFHPTCLYHHLVKNFLVTEALRGEGAFLISKSGHRFMEGVHPLKELAPRDIVARTIDAQMKKTGDSHVFLDISHMNQDFITKHFPGIYKKCMEVGIDITKSPIPVVPAAHYSCGGVITDEWGQTSVDSLWAIGEVACTGLHGANRLASNSLLEGLAFAQFTFEDIQSKWDDISKNIHPKVEKWRLGKDGPVDELAVVSQLWNEIRRTMWNYVGIVRTDKRLERAEARISQISLEMEHYYSNFTPSRSLLEVKNLALVAQLTIKCARMRKESRGIHYSLDHLTTDELKRDSVLLS